MKRRQSGFTLIEIAIVLVIIGLLLGGVLKGQELITGARVRNLVAQQDGIKAAYFGFLDRYRGLPGDYAQAAANIPNIAAVCGGGDGNGDGNGVIETAAAGEYENILVWEHLSRAGFINGTYNCVAGAATNGSNPSNPYGGLLDMAQDALYLGTPTARHNLKTGGAIPSDILAEVDRKVDDGVPHQGSFRAAPAAPPATCAGAAAWVTATPGADCSGTSLF